jgi:predicted peptidase
VKLYFFIAIFFCFVLLGLAKSVYVDPDTDCFYVPQKVIDADKKVPALLYLSCTGAIKSDLDSIKFIGDSLGWIIFSCHKTRNHRDAMQNDVDIIKTYNKAIKKYPIDTSRVFIYGFSGQGVQALLEMFLHPTKFKGVHTVCAHTGAMSLAKWSTLKNQLAYLISRQEDWNLQQNYQIDQAFKLNGIKDTLVITPGEHGIGDKFEIFRAIKWLKKNL